MTGRLVAKVAEGNEGSLELADTLGYRLTGSAGGSVLIRRDGPAGRR